MALDREGMAIVSPDHGAVGKLEPGESPGDAVAVGTRREYEKRSLPTP